MQPDNHLLQQMGQLNLSVDEAIIYLELLKGPATHLRLSHNTGINRTKVYRIVQDLEKRSLINRQTDDRGTFLAASDPSTLEVELVTNEEKLKQQWAAYESLVPTLSALKNNDGNTFVVRTYEGDEGHRQMLWHELKARGDIAIFGSGTTEQLIPDHALAEKHRLLARQAGNQIRELMNYGAENIPPDFSGQEEYNQFYSYRRISEGILPLHDQTAIYMETVAIYHWRHGQKVGVEIVNRAFSQMMRSMFEYYWSIAEEPKPGQNASVQSVDHPTA